MYQYIFFDLDGTLTDPKLGITKSVQYALGKMGIDEPDRDKLEPFIGPPLADSFHEFYGMNEEQCESAIKAYREYFEKDGIRENELYPGMQELLEELKEAGMTLVVASSKPEDFVHIILKHFGIDKYFDLVVGSLKDGSRLTKIEVMEEAFSRLDKLEKRKGRKPELSKVLMAGDRRFDIEGAKHFGIDSVAVTYGYAPDGELAQAQPTWMADSVTELGEVIMQRPDYARHQKKHSVRKTLEILYPLAIYWFWELLVFNVLYFVLARLFKVSASAKEPVSVALNAVAALSTWPILLLLYQRSRRKETSLVIVKKKRKKLLGQSVLIAVYAMMLAIGLNMLITVLRLTQLSQSYEKVSDVQYSVPLLAGLFVYGLITPVTEELIFRGVIQNRIRAYFPRAVAIFVSALIFGCYHVNFVQVLYATLMGLAIAMLYEYYGHIAAPMLFHIAANSIVYVITKTVSDRLSSGAVIYAGVLLCLALGLTVWYVVRFCRERKKYFTF